MADVDASGALEERLATLVDEGSCAVSVAAANQEDGFTWGVQATASTRFQAASISKVATALLVIRLHELKLLNLKDDIAPMLGPVRLNAPEPVRLVDVLAHTGGLNVSAIPGISRNSSEPRDLVERVSGCGAYDRIVAIGPPNERWSYSGGGYALIQVALEQTFGSPFIDLLTEHVLAPLGMQDSGADPSSDFAVGHDNHGEPIEGDYCNYPEVAAAGLWSTPSDLVRLWGAVVTHGFLTEPGWYQLISGRLSRRSMAGMLSGPMSNPQVWHAGSNVGFRALSLGYVRGRHRAAIMVASEQGAGTIDRLLPQLAEAFEWPNFDPPA